MTTPAKSCRQSQTSCTSNTASPLREAAHKLREWLDVLGLNPENKQESIPEKVLSLVEERAQAKQARDFAKADEIRQEIQNLGYQVADTPQGPKVTPL